MEIAEISDILKCAIRDLRVSRILQGEKLCLEFNICLIAYRFPTIVGVSNNFQQSQQSISNNCWKTCCFRDVNVKRSCVWQASEIGNYLEHNPINKTHVLHFWVRALLLRYISRNIQQFRISNNFQQFPTIVGFIVNLSRINTVIVLWTCRFEVNSLFIWHPKNKTVCLILTYDSGPPNTVVPTFESSTIVGNCWNCWKLLEIVGNIITLTTLKMALNYTFGGCL